MDWFYRFPFVYLNLAFIAGILFAFLLIPVIFLILSLGLIIILLWSRKYQCHFHVLLVIAFFFMGWGNSVNHQAKINNVFSYIAPLDEQPVEAVGTIRHMAKTKSGKYRIEVNNVEIFSSKTRLKNRFEYFVYLNEKPDLKIDDTLRVMGTFLLYESQRNPGQFDLQKYYKKQDIYGLILPDKNTAPVIIKSKGFSTRRLLETVRDGIRTQCSAYLDTREVGLLTALLIGDRSGLDPEMKWDFQNTGVIHVLAVSGLHVGYILLILTTLTPILKIPWGYDRLFILAGIWGFAALTNFTPSVNRACLMAGLYMLAPVFHRPKNPWNILSATSCILLIINPGQLFKVGFLLSFAAVGSILFFYNEINSSLPEKLKVKSITKPVFRYPWALFLVSLSAQIGTIPITILIFHKLPVVALIANVFIVPLVGVLVAGGILLLCFSWLPIVAGWFANSIWLTTTLIQSLAKFFSGIPYGVIVLNNFRGFHIILYILLTIGLVSVLRKNYKVTILNLLICVNMMIWHWSLSSAYMDVLFLDVGQGDSAVIRFENGKTMVIDTGYRFRRMDMGKQVVIPVLNYLGVSKIDWLVLSHPHSDHIGGTMSVMSQFPVGTIIDTDIDYGSYTYNQILEYAEEKSIGYKNIFGGDAMKIDDRTYLQCFHPDTGIISDYNINNGSLVFRIVYGETSFLFAGDAEREAENEMAGFGRFLDSDVLKVGHHGSITSSSLDFLNNVSPKVAVISVGEKNKFNHPSDMIISRIQSLGATIFRTDECGAIWFRSDGKSIERIQWK